MKSPGPFIHPHQDERTAKQLVVSDILSVVNGYDLADDEQWLTMVLRKACETECELSHESLARAIYARLAR